MEQYLLKTGKVKQLYVCALNQVRNLVYGISIGICHKQLWVK